MDIKELYQEIILDHGKNPRNKNKLIGHLARKGFEMNLILNYI